MLIFITSCRLELLIMHLSKNKTAKAEIPIACLPIFCQIKKIIKLKPVFFFQCRLPLSSSVFAYNALFTKPAQSVAPMLIVALLDRNHYQEKLTGNITPSEHVELQSAMFLVACAIPFVIGLLQILVWRSFSIRDSHITIAKHIEL